MRDKLNKNPVAQVSLIAVLLIGCGFILLKGMGGGDSAPAPASTATTDAATGAALSPAPSTTTAASGEAAGVAAAATPAAVPVPPLPAPLRRAYGSGKTVVLLVVRGGGIDDSMVEPTVRRLSAIGGIAVFVAPARRIAKYAAITLGVNVDRVPALVVVRPRALSGGTPQASVSYGFQSPETIVQAVIDASYNGPAATYHPN
jgi:hypothetical protein